MDPLCPLPPVDQTEEFELLNVLLTRPMMIDDAIQITEKSTKECTGSRCMPHR